MVVSAARLEANRRNAQRSTGPRDCERSKFNALKHGMRAKTPVLQDEDPQALAARKASWSATLAPQNDLEQRAVDDDVAYSWLQDRARRAQLARLDDIFLDHGVAEAKAIAKEVEDLGRRLFTDRMGPVTFYPTGCDYDAGECERTESTSYAGEGKKDSDHPADLVLELTSTLRGCEWMLQQWADLKAILERGQPWLSSDKLKAVRLLGKQPFDAIDDRDVAMVFLASFALKGEKGQWCWEILTEMNDQDTERFRRNAADRQLKSLMPADADKAREALLEIIARATEPLTAEALAYRQRAEVKAALAADYLAFDDSEAGERLRRHEAAASRGMARALDTLFKLRRAPARASGQLSAGVSGPLSVVSGTGEPIVGAQSREGEAPSEPRQQLARHPGTAHGHSEGASPSGVANIDTDGLTGAIAVSSANDLIVPAATSEATGNYENATNEPNDEFVRCPSSVVSGESVTNEPNDGSVRCPSSVVSGKSLTNEPNDHRENVTNEPNDELVRFPSSVGIGENPTNDAIGADGPEPGHWEYSAATTRWEELSPQAQEHLVRVENEMQQAREKLRQRRAEETRKLNEQARWVVKEKRARRAERTSGEPKGQSTKRAAPTEKQRERELLRQAMNELKMLTGGIVAPRKQGSPAGKARQKSKRAP
jgi:hypothetical protein